MTGKITERLSAACLEYAEVKRLIDRQHAAWADDRALVDRWSKAVVELSAAAVAFATGCDEARFSELAPELSVAAIEYATSKDRIDGCRVKSGTEFDSDLAVWRGSLLTLEAAAKQQAQRAYLAKPALAMIQGGRA